MPKTLEKTVQAQLAIIWLFQLIRAADKCFVRLSKTLAAVVTQLDGQLY